LVLFRVFHHSYDEKGVAKGLGRSSVDRNILAVYANVKLSFCGLIELILAQESFIDQRSRNSLSLSKKKTTCQCLETPRFSSFAFAESKRELCLFLPFLFHCSY